MSDIRVRFAPSPTGMLHIGGVRTALWDWLLAKRHGGKFILRIEDTDQRREAEGGVAQIMEALRWYGLEWDEGPDVGGPFAPYVQSQRLPFYRQYAEQLLLSGHAYRAYDTPERLQSMRDEQQRRGLPPGYDRLHRELTAEECDAFERDGAPCVIRLKTPREGRTTFVDAVFGEIGFDNKVLDDAILLKSDGFPTYHLAHVVDDHLMQISHVLRGEEWISSTPLHILLFQALGWKPPTYAHLAVMLNKDGKKLAKRDKTGTALAYGDEGYLQEAMVNFLAVQGWSDGEDRDIYSVDELIERFSLEGLINRSPKVDFDKLLWYNGVYIRSLSLPQLAERVQPFLQRAGLLDASPSSEELAYVGKVMALEQERLKTLADAPAIADFFLVGDDELVFEEKSSGKWFGSAGVRERMAAVREGLSALEAFDHASTEGVVRDVIARFDVKSGEVIHPLRIAVTGRSTGPGLFETIAVLGRTRVLRRLDRAISSMTG